MPSPMYMTIDGGGVAGSVLKAGREGTVELIKVDHDLHIPTDIHTGALSGVRQHSAMTVQAAIDSATPYVYQACTSGSTYPTVQIDFYKINDDGVDEIYFTILMENCKTASVVVAVPNVKDMESEHMPHVVEYKFVYSIITWTFTDGTLEWTDDWLA